MIKILKASAGSGKTYNLAREYISILLGSIDRHAYRHVLAVTFTNKATAEMKSRILKELHLLATDPESSGYFKDFVPVPCKDVETLRSRARRILVDILHDYGSFYVSTIDKFFQMTLKAFSREVGQFASYQIELDRKALVHESVDRILDGITEDSTELIGRLNEGVMAQLRQGKRVNLERGLYDMAEKLKNEERRERSETLGIDPAVAFSEENLAAVRAECDRVIDAFAAALGDAARAVLAVLDEAGVPPSESNNHFLSQVENYVDIVPGRTVEKPTAAFMLKAADSSSWFAKAKAKKYLPLVEGVLEGPLGDFCAMFDTPMKMYNTAVLLREQAFSLRLAGDFYREFDALLKEKNVLGIDDSNTLLRDIIDGSDAPFVYEKMGVRFEDFLLDEFQDTSTIQWQNFLPLLRESDASGRPNLVVGDVKQSIYRWRGSDWNLLATRLPEQFRGADVKTLDCNWRSCEAIVRFNNTFFEYAAEAVGVEGIYSDVKQEVCASDSQEGYVRLTFCDGPDQEDQAVLDSLNEAYAAGAKYGDMAVLVRNNAEGGRIAAFLMEAGIPVISDDSLRLKSSVTVRRLVSLLSCMENPDDSVSSYLASSMNISFPEGYHSLTDLCEGLLREMFDHDPSCFEGEALYIQSFMDYLQDWCAANGNGLMRFLKDWNDQGTDPFLSSPSGGDSVRIMTIHKSKGLEFPYVVFPYAEKVRFYKGDWHWCRPADAADEFPASSGAIFPVCLTKGAADTAFSPDYEKERSLQVVDNLNTFYVALTRAEKSLHVIACKPSAASKKEGPSDFSQVLRIFAGTDPLMQEILTGEDEPDVFEYGTPYDFNVMERSEQTEEEIFPLAFRSWPLAGRLRLSTDASDFFAEDGSAGASASKRLGGIIMHDILASVRRPGDLRAAVDAAVADGRLTAAEGKAEFALLRERIASAAARGWFPPDGAGVLNEHTVFDADGREFRPDRVVVTPGHTYVIDYKSGEHSEGYRAQVRRYVRLFRQMGYPEVSGHIWYIHDDVVENT
ncbi:MAG: UvrD-helicase domain-containing protein [Bacteroidales bacterium]|nr:UvrD-helicase domain-containing protein [Bacteroidales bacterium]